MTGPLNPVVGQARVELVADGSRMPATVRDELEDLGNDSKIDRELKETGREWGEVLGDGMGDGIHRSAPSILDRLTGALDGQHIRPNITIEYGADGSVRRFWVKSVSEGLERAVKEESSSSGGGAFGKVGAAISDAIGAGFNISGRSPLIVGLIFVLGYIVELVIGAIQAISGLSAILFTIPAAIAAITLQVGILFLAFRGMGDAIQNAFAATNAQELNEAIKDLTPSAQEFVRSLLPLRDLFRDLSKLTQQSFFEGLGNGIQLLESGLRKIDATGIQGVANALGYLGREFLRVFDHPAFAEFANKLLPATTWWLGNLASAVYDLALGLIDISNAALPFFQWLGGTITQGLSDFGKWLSDLSEDENFISWLEDMKETLAALWSVLKMAGAAIFALFKSIDEAGGKDLLIHIAEQLGRLAFVLDSGFGVEAMRALIGIVRLLADSLFGIIFVIMAILYAFRAVWVFISEILWPFFMNLFTKWIPEAIWFAIKAIGAFLKWLIVDVIGGFLGWLIESLFGLFASFLTWITNIGSNISDFFTVTVPNAIRDAVSNFGHLLYDAGKNLIQGLINGIKSMWGALRDAISGTVKVIANFIVSNSPIEEGPLSPQEGGDPKMAGQNIVKRLADGMTSATSTIGGASSDVASAVVDSGVSPITQNTATGGDGMTVYVYLGTEQITEILDARVQYGLAGTARAMSRRPRTVG